MSTTGSVLGSCPSSCKDALGICFSQPAITLLLVPLPRDSLHSRNCTILHITVPFDSYTHIQVWLPDLHVILDQERLLQFEVIASDWQTMQSRALVISYDLYCMVHWPVLYDRTSAIFISLDIQSQPGLYVRPVCGYKLQKASDGQPASDWGISFGSSREMDAMLHSSSSAGVRSEFSAAACRNVCPWGARMLSPEKIPSFLPSFLINCKSNEFGIAAARQISEIPEGHSAGICYSTCLARSRLRKFHQAQQYRQEVKQASLTVQSKGDVFTCPEPSRMYCSENKPASGLAASSEAVAACPCSNRVRDILNGKPSTAGLKMGHTC